MVQKSLEITDCTDSKRKEHFKQIKGKEIWHTMFPETLFQKTFTLTLESCHRKSVRNAFDLTLIPLSRAV